MDLRDEAPQYVLPLVVRVERATPPTRTDALEAAALAVLALLTDPRAHPAPPADTPAPPEPPGNGRPGEPAGDGQAGEPAGTDPAAGAGEPAGTDPAAGAGEPGEWAAAVTAWADARIRKVVRRARGVEWRRAEALPGITVRHGTAEVRVFPPVPLDGWPRELAKLQVSGTDLDDPADPSAPAAGTPVIWLSPSLTMTTGKAMAQVGHAAQLGLAALPADVAERWRLAGFPLAVRTADEVRWAALLAGGAPVVRDAGFTEVAPGTCTAVAELVSGATGGP